MASCITETDEMPASYALKKFLNCNDNKFLALFHDFQRFIEEYCEHNGTLLEEANLRMNERKHGILGYRSYNMDFQLFDAYRGRKFDLMEAFWKEAESKLPSLNEKYKIDFLESEIRKVKALILKASAKENIDKTEHQVSMSTIIFRLISIVQLHSYTRF